MHQFVVFRYMYLGKKFSVGINAGHGSTEDVIIAKPHLHVNAC